MATTTNPDGRDVEGTVVYAEDDKLGPLGSRPSLIDDEAELRRVLVAELQSAADAARRASASVDDSAATSVHEYRKALRRARAVLSLVADALPRNEHEAVLRALRDARRALGTARDLAVAPDTVSLLSLGDDERATLDTVLSLASEAMPPVSEVRQLLAEGAARTAAQVEALEAALPATLSWSTIARGVRDVYRRARRARKDARRSKRAFHLWRRRSKELVYQLDLLAGYTGAGVSQLHREIEAVTQTQGPVVDLIMLREIARTHGAGVAPDALQAVLNAISSEISRCVADSRRAGRDAFERTPRRFARKLTKRAKRDLARADVPDDVD